MSDAIDREIRHELARNAHRAGYSLLPLREGTKKCFIDDWPNAEVPWSTLSWHVRKGANVAVRLDGIVCIDADGPSGESWIARHGIDSTQVVLTSKGRHVYLKAAEGVRTRIRHLGLELDVLTGPGHYAVFPFSTARDTGWTYDFAPSKRMVPPGELPDFPLSLLGELLKEPCTERKKECPAVGRVVGGTRHAARRIGNPEAYALRVESHEGSGGSRGLVRVVACLRDAGWDPGRIYRFLAEEWNRPPRVTPVWPEEDLARAVRRHAGDF